MYRTSARPASLDFLLPSAPSGFDLDRRKDVGFPHTLPQLPSVYFEAPVRDGLRTPPADEMAATYQPQYKYGTYNGQKDAPYPATGAPSSYMAPYHGSSAPSIPYSTSSLPPPASSSTSRTEVYGQQQARGQPPSPQRSSENALASAEDTSQRKSANDLIRPNLRIPSTISKDGGSLPDFAAQITCLFWFESTATLEKAERTSRSSSPVRRLRDDAIPSTGFRKWVVMILSTTQVTDKVIILALLFIYRLKKINPGVKGKVGSEYRLLTVALMLGNKFLDDNTYTNKTWAEVSGISVTEIHVMEVEFLSNMRYSLLASKEEWAEWHESLSNIKLYLEQARNAPHPQTSPLVGATHRQDLPSPPTSLQTSPPTLTYGHPASSGALINTHRWPATNNLAPLTAPLPPLPDYDPRQQSRKRSYDGDADEPVAKRVTRPSTTPVQFIPGVMPTRSDVPRLPVPNLTISTSQPTSNNYHTPTTISQNGPLLPPLSGRSMSIVYPTTPNTWTPQLPMLTPTGPHSVNPSGYSTPTRRHSPHSVQELLSYSSSPILGNFPGHNQGHVSPSIFLQQRSSPYKPVRHFDTLLYPPPSASMHDYSINVDQMHYQPLGKRNDYRPGIVPDYANPTPYQQHWPVLPQPNFQR